ncbi:hypothetical protein [Chroococcidiopsis sp. TS-821]|uniref:hypothetical protein n=1 Tax=Chroococcidiopsis sp. TS-821 TaxID=1378066 RepID=UPI001AEF3CF2|nr:hypothetical protein [Chroococcidiopsis sp. TS-821]
MMSNSQSFSDRLAEVASFRISLEWLCDRTSLLGKLDTVAIFQLFCASTICYCQSPVNFFTVSDFERVSLSTVATNTKTSTTRFFR